MNPDATMSTHLETAVAENPNMTAIARRQRLQDSVFHRVTQGFSLLVLVALATAGVVALWFAPL